MKYAFFVLIAIMVNLDQGWSDSAEIGNENVTFVKFDKFKIYVYPSLNFEKEHAFFSTGSFKNPDMIEDELASFWTGLVTKKLTFYAINWNLIVGEKYFNIPPNCNEVWLIGNMLIGRGIGEIRESRLSKEFETSLKANRQDITYSYNGVNYMVKSSLFHGCRRVNISEEKYILVIGNRYFTVDSRNLGFLGKNYGPVSEGDVVLVDCDGNLKIQHTEADPKVRPLGS